MKSPFDAAQLGIDLQSQKETQVFRWFLVCLLNSKPVSPDTTRQAYATLSAAGLTSINRLVKTSWDMLVDLLDKAGYKQYDFSAATMLLQIAKDLKRDYGTVSRLIKQAKDIRQLEDQLLAFGGIGPATAALFIRDVAPVWFKATLPHDYHSATLAAKILQRHNFAAYIIGGAVRDLWLGREPKDFDLVTNATPEQIMAIPEFGQSKYKDTAQAFGVTRVKFKHRGSTNDLEIATFRKDIEAHRGRKATKVVFAELEDDVRRRDLTINALALDTDSYLIIDYVDGLTDLDAKLIRFIGQATARIREDPLRIMRAIRFKNQLDFAYHPTTATAIRAAVRRGDVETIAIDRLRDELTNLLIHPSRRQAMLDLNEFDILDRVLPEVTAGKGVSQPWQFHTEGDVWQHQLLILDHLPTNPSPRLVWAALLHDIGKAPTSIKPRTAKGRIRFSRHHAVGAEMAETILKRLKFSNRDIQAITWMIYNHLTIDDLPAMRPSRQQRLLGHPAFEDLLELHRADAAASWRPKRPHGIRPRFRSIEHLWHQYQSKTPEHRQPSLKRDLGFDGSWLLEQFSNQFEHISGPTIGAVLRDLDDWYRDEAVTDKSAYIKKARQLLAQYQPHKS